MHNYVMKELNYDIKTPYFQISKSYNTRSAQNVNNFFCNLFIANTYCSEINPYNLIHIFIINVIHYRFKYFQNCSMFHFILKTCLKKQVVNQ